MASLRLGMLTYMSIPDSSNLLKQFHSQFFRISNLHLVTLFKKFIHWLVSCKKHVIK